MDCGSGWIKYPFGRPANLPEELALAIVRSKEATAVLTKDADIEVPVRMTTSKYCGYFIVTPCVMVDLAE